jgi:large subunit ribosomal protein L28
MFGRKVSHAHNVSPRTFMPNLQKIRVRSESGGARRTKVCTRCIRSGSVAKAVR